MQYEIGHFKKVKWLIITIKKCFLKKIDYLTSTYKSDNLSGKLSKRTKCVYIYIYIYIYKITSC